MKRKRKILPEEICKAYEAGKSIPEISKLVSLCLSTTRLSLIASGVKLRTIKEASKFSAHKISKIHLGRKKGPMKESAKQLLRDAALKRSEISAVGFSLKPNGYMEITKGPNKGRGAHVVIMESIIGRKLSKNEVVHHRDRNRQNNDPTNLQLMTRSKHTSLHRKEGW